MTSEQVLCARRVLATVCAVASLAVLAVTAPGAGARHIDSIFKTDTLDFDCFDGTLAGTETGDAFYCQTDNHSMTVWRQASIPAGSERTNIGGVLDEEFRPTDLDVIFVRDPAFGGDSETDVIYQKGPVPTGTAAVTWCNDAVEGGPDGEPCDQHYARFDNFITRSLACHESGHAVGLTHGEHADPPVSNNNSSLECMREFSPNDELGLHNRQLINDEYN
jgi:hypothetical protein